MGKQIVIQPSGKYAIWSSVVDDFVCVDCENETEVIEYFLECERENIVCAVNDKIQRLKQGEKPYNQFTKSFDECIEIIRELHGNNAESLQLLGMTK